MTRRAASAGLCALAAIALLIAGFVPWFEIKPGTGEDRDAFRGMYDPARPGAWAEGDEAPDRELRANYGLVGGEVCERLRCQPHGYAGARGLSDDLFAWLGRLAMGATMSAVALLVVLAFARGQRRPILRGWAATVVATAAGLGAAFVASEVLSRRAIDLQAANGLVAMIVGAALAGLGIGWPTGEVASSASPARRWGLTAALALLVLIAWIAVGRRAWWSGAQSFGGLHASPLGLEACADGRCHVASIGAGRAGLTLLARLTVALAAAAIVPALGAAARAGRGVTPGAWAWSAAVLAGLALTTGIATAVSYAGNDVMTIGWGLPVFVVAMSGVVAAALVAAATLRTADVELEGDATRGPQLRAAPPRGPGAPGDARAGLRPVLPALAAAPGPSGTAAAPGPGASNGHARYAPRPPVVTTGAVASGAAAASAAAVASIIAPDPAWVAAGPGAMTLTAPAPDALGPGIGQAATAGRALAPRGGSGPATHRTAPTCPTCRVSTLWHGKRQAWWCSTCKQTL